MIGGFGLGVAGSAYGTAAAQFVALGIMLVYRLDGKSQLGLPDLTPTSWLRGWS